MKTFRVLMFESFKGELFDFACEYEAASTDGAAQQATVEFPESIILDIREV